MPEEFTFSANVRAQQVFRQAEAQALKFLQKNCAVQINNINCSSTDYQGTSLTAPCPALQCKDCDCMLLCIPTTMLYG